MLSERPWSNFTLVSVIIFKYLDTHTAISDVAGHKMVNNLCSGLISPNSGIMDVSLPKKQFLLMEKVMHSNIACLSSSILLEVQYLQILEATGVTGLV